MTLMQKYLLKKNMNNFYQSKEWKEVRNELAKTGCCAVCGQNYNVNVHHKVSIKEGGKKLSWDNLMILCSRHHASFHRLQQFYKNNHAPRSSERIINEIKKKHEEIHKT